MLRKRIIFALIYNNGIFTQSRNFRLQNVGDINWLEKNYKFQNIATALDELIVIDASKKNKSIEKFAEVVSKLVNDVFIPICAGGGIKSLKDAELLFNSGADKIIVNSIIYTDPDLVRNLIKIYGSQSIVASIDYKINGNTNEVYIYNGTHKINLELSEYLKYIETLDIGEIYLNSIDKDGTGFGYDFTTINTVCKNLKKPLIIAGGAGNELHFEQGLSIPGVNAVATANLFNFIGDGLPRARNKLIEIGENLANWNFNK
jgi:cyclase